MSLPTIIATASTARAALSHLESAPGRRGRGLELSTAEVDTATGLLRLTVASIEKAQAKVGEGIMTAPDASDKMAREASLLLSMLAEGSVKSLPLSQGGAEAQFDTRDWWGWAGVALAKFQHWTKYPIIRPPVQISPFPNSGRIGVLGDWGTNLYGAPICAQSITNDPGSFAMLLHLGDVYYSGTESEVKNRFLDVWPERTDTQLLNRALNSNHEMYSGGEYYFTATLAAFKQSASYFAVANDHWVLVGLDTAYIDHDIDFQQVFWLEKIIAHPTAKNKKVILFSHHQLFSRMSGQGSKLDAAIGELLRNGRIKAWYWGHEHRCCIYDPHPGYGDLYARCIGHSGMPELRDSLDEWPQTLTVTTPDDAVVWRRFSKFIPQNLGAGNTEVPAGLVLDGPNRYIIGEEKKFSPHGYATLEFNGDQLTERVFTPEGHNIHEMVIT